MQFVNLIACLQLLTLQKKKSTIAHIQTVLYVDNLSLIIIFDMCQYVFESVV